MNKKVILIAAPALLAGFFAFSTITGKKKTNCTQTAVCNHMMAEARLAPDTMRKDPICGMMADDTKKDTVHYKNKVYAFCSKYCKTEFQKDPAAHLPKKNQ